MKRKPIEEVKANKKKYKHEWYLKHKELTKERAKIWSAKNITKRKEINRRHYLNHLEQIAEYRKQYEKETEYSKRYHDNHVHRGWARGSIRRHKRNGYEVNISISELEQLALSATYCIICGHSFEWKWHQGVLPTRPTLDRINNEKVLNKDNVIIICARCNGTKLDRTMDDFIEYCKMVADKFGAKP